MTNDSLQTISQNFLKELKDANKGDKTSLAFLRNFVPTPFVKDNEIFQALVIGGSICQNARMKRNGKSFTILSQSEKEQPVFHTMNDFLSFFAMELDDTTTDVALNFAFPLKPLSRDGKLDGIFLHGTKEHAFEGLQGQKVGEVIERYIQKTQQRTITVCLANDTICLLLSGLTHHPFEKLACAIVGTGYNAAFFLTAHEAVNLEAGGFNKLPQDAIDAKLDTASKKPGMQTFEKQVSGAYLYVYFNLLLKGRNIPHKEISSTRELDELARGSSNIASLAQEVLQKSAALVACQIAAIAAYRKSDLICVVEGSLFWKGYQYKEAVGQALVLLSPKHTITFIQVENSSIMGAAKLIA